MARKEGKMNVSSIDALGDDLLRNVLRRLPSSSFASAACVSRYWNHLCDTVLCTPKLSSAHSSNPSLQEAVEEVFNKVFAELIRPHFAIVTVTSLDLEEARQLITKKLGSTIPIIYTAPTGLIGRDAITNEFKEIRWQVYFDRNYSYSVSFDDDDSAVRQRRVICLTVGFLPGLKVAAVPLFQSYMVPFVDEFLEDISECVTSVSGCMAPIGMILFTDGSMDSDNLLRKMDYSMSPETVIVGDRCGEFLCGNDSMNKRSKRKRQPLFMVAVALLFMQDPNKPPGIGDIKLHVALSAGLVPVGHTYEVTSVNESSFYWTKLTARSENSDQNFDEQTLRNIFGIGNQALFGAYIGIVKKRKGIAGFEEVNWLSSQIFHEVHGDDKEYLVVDSGADIKTGDCFRFFKEDSHMTSSSLRQVSDKFRDLKISCDVGNSDRQRIRPANSEKMKIFGGIIFSCISRGKPHGKANLGSSPFLENFPDVPLAGSFCVGEICRGDSSSYGQLSEEGSHRCCLHYNSSVYLLMSYTPSSQGS
ncbi:F-box/LRR-repeat protein At5g63520 [Daucus carota subsp. sativus]|uniref:F-box/LRR-repeat protein At5g63520 n=1 Tax=Daucus carota subsp. sativus TaxID=79200 RepID=UPI003082F962